MLAQLPAARHRDEHRDQGEAGHGAESLVGVLHKDRRGRRYWKQVGRDNHLLDAEVYAAACADSSWQPNLSGLARHLNSVKTTAPPESDTDGGSQNQGGG